MLEWYLILLGSLQSWRLLAPMCYFLAFEGHWKNKLNIRNIKFKITITHFSGALKNLWMK